jgi:hypothetical protein
MIILMIASHRESLPIAHYYKNDGYYNNRISHFIIKYYIIISYVNYYKDGVRQDHITGQILIVMSIMS